MMRTYGRINGVWVVVTTDANGFDDNVWLTTVCQALKLGLGESPFYSNTGIPATQSIVMQVFPDFYAAQVQQQFSPYFAALVIQRVQGSLPPVYKVNATGHSGAKLNAEVAT